MKTMTRLLAHAALLAIVALASRPGDVHAGSAAASPLKLLTSGVVATNAAIVISGDNPYRKPQIHVRIDKGAKVAVRLDSWHAASGFQSRRTYYLVRPKRGSWPRGKTLRITANGRAMQLRVGAPDKAAPAKLRLTRFQNATVRWGFPGRGGKRKLHYLHYAAFRDRSPVLRATVTYQDGTVFHQAIVPGSAGALQRDGHFRARCATVQLVDPAGNKSAISRLCR